MQKNLSSKLIIKFSQSLWHNFWIVVFISCDFSNKKVDCFGYYFFHAAITSRESSRFKTPAKNMYSPPHLLISMYLQFCQFLYGP